MAEVDIEYKGKSFEENPQVITWIQLFLIRFLKESANSSEWIDGLIEEWEDNVQIEIYKYIFDEELLSNPEKEEWALTFLRSAKQRMDEITLKDFSEYIGDEISEKVGLDRLKAVLLQLIDMIDL